MSERGGEPRTLELFLVSDEHPGLPEAPGGERIARVGRVRVPLTLPCQPWATLYRMPDGRLLAVLRLLRDGVPGPTVISTATLRRYARRSGLKRLESELERLVDHALRGHDHGPH